MTIKKNTLNHVHHKNGSTLNQHGEVDMTASNFIRLYNERANFFTDGFIKKIKEGNRKALSELLRHSLPPTRMDLRHEFLKCLKANTSGDYRFAMHDGKLYTMNELKHLVPEWASIAETALMESDPALADKLMTPSQWNAKCAFEVTFTNAMNELRDIKKAKQVTGGPDHYKKWIINPLHKAMEMVMAVHPPGNALVGYGDRIPLSEALTTARSLEDQFRKALAGKKK